VERPAVRPCRTELAFEWTTLRRIPQRSRTFVRSLRVILHSLPTTASSWLNRITSHLVRSTATEDFDEALDRRIRSLAAERELIQVQIAERRSKTPLAIHGLMDDLVKRKIAAEYVPKVPTGGKGDGDEDVLGEEREELERKDEMERTLEETLGILGELEKVSCSFSTLIEPQKLTRRAIVWTVSGVASTHRSSFEQRPCH
jgi:hypothetical protein